MMSRAIIYARSAGSSAQQVQRQRKLCRSYLREVGLTEVGFVSEYGHPGTGLSAVVNTAASKGATEVVVCDLSRLDRIPLVNSKNSNLLDEAGLTIHVAAGTVSGPVFDSDSFNWFGADKCQCSLLTLIHADI